MAKSKDKFRCWRSTYRISANDYFRSELTSDEFDFLMALYRSYKFQFYLNDPYFQIMRVSYRGYTLTAQKYVSGAYCLKFNINKSWKEKI